MTPEYISSQKTFYAAEIRRMELASRLLDTLGERLSESVSLAPSYYFQVTVDNRDDLSLFMTLAPKWNKTPCTEGISYDAMVDGERFQIIAKAAAIPPTCRMVEEEYVIPAEEAKPSRVGKRMVLRCEQAAEQVTASDVPFAVGVVS